MKTERSGARTALSASCSARDWRCSNQALRAFYEPAAVPPGFGVRQSTGAFRSGPRAQKRQRTAAVQDASAPAAASSRFMVPMHAQERKETSHEPERGAPAPPGPASQENVNRAGREPRTPIASCLGVIV